MSYRAAIFDLFGTLVPAYSAQDADRTVTAMADTLGIPASAFLLWWNKRLWRARLTGELPTIEAAVKAICDALEVPVRPEQIAAVTRLRLQFARRALKPRPDALGTLRRVAAIGFKLGLISDCSADVPAVWPETAFAPLIPWPLFSCQVGFTKPDPRIYRLACARLSVSPAECLYVGDGSSRELTGATVAGMHAVLLRSTYAHCPDPVRPDVDRWQGDDVTHLRDVLALMD